MLDVNKDGRITVEDYELLTQRFKEEDNWTNEDADAFYKRLMSNVEKFGFKKG